MNESIELWFRQDFAPDYKFEKNNSAYVQAEKLFDSHTFRLFIDNITAYWQLHEKRKSKTKSSLVAL